MTRLRPDPSVPRRPRLDTLSGACRLCDGPLTTPTLDDAHGGPAAPGEVDVCFDCTTLALCRAALGIHRRVYVPGPQRNGANAHAPEAQAAAV